jgi:hypothetical protein
MTVHAAVDTSIHLLAQVSSATEPSAEQARGLGSMLLWLLVIFAIFSVGLILLFFTRRIIERRITDPRSRFASHLPDAWAESARRIQTPDAPPPVTTDPDLEDLFNDPPDLPDPPAPGTFPDLDDDDDPNNHHQDDRNRPK